MSVSPGTMHTVIKELVAEGLLITIPAWGVFRAGGPGRPESQKTGFYTNRVLCSV
jgi:hypothetical protein